jgi:hypothetical protein
MWFPQERMKLPQSCSPIWVAEIGREMYPNTGFSAAIVPRSSFWNFNLLLVEFIIFVYFEIRNQLDKNEASFQLLLTCLPSCYNNHHYHHQTTFILNERCKYCYIYGHICIFVSEYICINRHLYRYMHIYMSIWIHFCILHANFYFLHSYISFFPLPLPSAVKRGLIRSPKEGQVLMNRLTVSTDLHSLSTCDLVIEAVYEVHMGSNMHITTYLIRSYLPLFI